MKLKQAYPDLSLWKDVSSFKKEDGKSDFYMMLQRKWKFIGRFDDFIEAWQAFVNIEKMKQEQ